MDSLQVNEGSQADRILRKVIGSSEYTSSQICTCDSCGNKIVSDNGNCDIGCARCGSSMRAHTGMVKHTAAPIPDEDGFVA